MTSVLYVAYEFPSLTQTFVYREVEQLSRLGARVRVISLRRPSEDIGPYDEARRAIDQVDYVGYVSPVAGLGHLVSLLFTKPAAVLRSVGQLFAPVSPLRLRLPFVFHLLQACYIVRTYDVTQFDLIHAHFAAGPGSIALFMSTLSGVPFGITAHAYDLFEDQVVLRAKLRHAALFVTISEFNRSWLRRRFGADAESVSVVRCGVDIAQLSLERTEVVRVDHRIVAVGSLNLKKGHDVLIRACGILRDQGRPFDCRIVGAGSEHHNLMALISELHLELNVTLVGALPQEAVRREIAQAEVSVLACRQSPSGDMDGIPVALMESMAMGAAVVSTTVSGLPELISSETNGLLVAPESPEQLASALARLLSDGALRARFAGEGIRTVRESFDLCANSAKLLALMESAVAKVGVSR